ncbi:hypothetical protein, partial [uncultured Campylobacter sp.]|uniref:hypothetical protein n=1 Tax=uncultured Campylobacter sp. TaxID=218934 RepID=UPI00262391FA
VNASAVVAVCKALNKFIADEAGGLCEIGHGVFMGLARYQSGAQIMQEGLNGFFAEVLEPIFRCASSGEDTATSLNERIAEAKDVFKF